MILIKNARDLVKLLSKFRSDNLKIGFVPTMGALHEGHISLIKRCITDNEICAASIFINPTQFTNLNDFNNYPSTIEADLDILERNGCNVLFLPSVKEMYPSDHKTKFYDLGYIDTIMEAAFRPGHYQGVCQVVDKLLSLVEPDRLYLGQKDYQQCMVIRKLIELERYPVEVVVVATVRETSGLAMSSRNMRLSPEEKLTAAAISRNLFYVRDQIENLPATSLKQGVTEALNKEGFKVDYIEIADKITLKAVEKFAPGSGAVVLVAATLHDVRLIDNVLI